MRERKLWSAVIRYRMRQSIDRSGCRKRLCIQAGKPRREKQARAGYGVGIRALRRLRRRVCERVGQRVDSRIAGPRRASPCRQIFIQLHQFFTSQRVRLSRTDPHYDQTGRDRQHLPA
jgi:hypothetical protein